MASSCLVVHVVALVVLLQHQSVVIQRESLGAHDHHCTVGEEIYAVVNEIDWVSSVLRWLNVGHFVDDKIKRGHLSEKNSIYSFQSFTGSVNKKATPLLVRYNFLWRSYNFPVLDVNYFHFRLDNPLRF